MWIRNEKPIKRKAIEHYLPCGFTVKAKPHFKNESRWIIEVFAGTRRCVATFQLEVTPQNANSVYQLLQKIVHQTPGVEEKPWQSGR